MRQNKKYSFQYVNQIHLECWEIKGNVVILTNKSYERKKEIFYLQIQSKHNLNVTLSKNLASSDMLFLKNAFGI